VVNKDIIVNFNLNETRHALLENGALMEIFVEQEDSEKVVGNIYKGRVTSILPGIEAAFVDIGLDRGAFLYVSDVAFNTGGFKDYEDGPLYLSGEKSQSPRYTRPPEISIDDLLKVGQEILVQAVKEPMESKGPRVTTHLSLPGRHLVLMPLSKHIGISRRIKDEDERERLRAIIERIKPPDVGVIVRTEGEDKGEDGFGSDLNFLVGAWQRILKKASLIPAPSLVHRDLDLIFKTIRDLFTDDTSRLVIDSWEKYLQIIDFLETSLPHLAPRVFLYDKKEPIFDSYGIESEIEKTLRRKVWLKSGGCIVIDQAEALVAIDVNSGKMVDKKNLEETALQTNLEAAKEIARQLRLRDIGGIIILDFIDMEKPENKGRVVKALKEALRSDRSKTHLSEITELGLLQMTRKKVKKSLSKTICQPCPYCGGRGVVFSEATIETMVERELKRVCSVNDDKELLVFVHPRIATRMSDEVTSSLERKLDRKIYLKADKGLHLEDIKILSMSTLKEIN